MTWWFLEDTSRSTIPFQSNVCCLAKTLSTQTCNAFGSSKLNDWPPKPIQPDHLICKRHFIAITHQDTTGRIIVRLPFKDNPAALGEPFDIARRRFLPIERRFFHSPDTYSQYVSFIEEYERVGHMSVVKTPNLDEPHYYIPHQQVSLNKNLRKFHYILWRAFPDADLLTYQLNNVTYGTTSAP